MLIVSYAMFFRYYVGRKNMFDGDYATAVDYLSFAFEHCHVDAKRNKKLILIYLVPVRVRISILII